MDDAEKQYQKGIENGANMLAKEIDRELINRFVGKGQLQGTPEEFRAAQETFKNTDIAAVCRKINTP